MATVLLAWGCGGEPPGNGMPGPNPTSDTIEKANPDGDEQAGLPGATLPNPIRVVVRNGGSPVSGKTVTWQPSGGSVDPASSTTGGDGTATTTVTLPQGGSITIQAASTGASGSPVTFDAYVAADMATVQVVNNRFDPDVVAIRAGGTVTFDWPAGSLQHDLMPDDGRDRPDVNGLRDGPFNQAFLFVTPGEYYYHCTNHGGTRSGMFGRIIVVP